MTTITTVFRGEDKVKQRLTGVVTKTLTGISRAVSKEALNLVAYVKSNKLSDQVLHVRTGRLRRSITARFTGEGTDTFTATVGTNVVYARAHEYGFRGTVNVREHSVREHKRMQTTAFGKPMKEPREVSVASHVVKGHAMRMNIPEKSFLRSSLTENKDRILRNVQVAIGEALR